MTYEKYDNSDYWEFVPKDQRKELKQEGKLPSHAETKVPKNHQISDMSSLDELSVIRKRNYSKITNLGHSSEFP